ncbi:sulfurtransferase complex subunit TusD [Pontibacterium sp.]|uniref:sulfurtransferase complex subunit TusD n=1 Tax=Pontibacterium sp. TaxID=2036026 RepID=UPI0035119F6F
MKFSIVVQAAPYSCQSAETAYRFAKTLLDKGHDLHRVFFYGDGVHTGSALASPPQDEPNIPANWQALAADHDLDLVVCIAAAVRRGVLDDKEAGRYSKSGSNLADGFELSGLGQLADAIAQSDRVVTFGA